MIVVDNSLSVEIKEIIQTFNLNEEIKILEKFNEIIPAHSFNIFFLDQKSVKEALSSVQNFKNTYFFIFWDGEKVSSDDLSELEYFTYINKSLNAKTIKKQLKVFFVENIVLEKVQFCLNQSFKAKLENQASLLKGIESKLVEVHKNMVPLRKAVAPNMKLYSKYALGSDVGGEFVDFEKNSDHLFLIMFSTNSYLLSSDLVEIVLDLRRKKIFNFESFKNKILEFISVRNENFDFLVTKINFRDLTMESIGKGYKTFLNSNNLSLSALGDEKSVALSPGEKVMFFSPGLLEYASDTGINLQQLHRKDIEESFNDVFSEVRNLMTSGLGGPDATMAILEVQKNAFKTI